MSKDKEQRGLGRGLSALLADVDMGDRGLGTVTSTNPDNIPIDMIVANAKQPRKDFPEEELKELASSIGEKGIIQPLIVRKLAEDKYQIVAGERRWRAAQMAKLHMVPAVVRNYTDAEVQEIAIIENIQRQDLNVIDEAEAYKALIAEFGHTQEALSKILGKSRSHIANLIRITELDGELREYVRKGQLSMGHARALLTAQNPTALARMAIKKELSVRDVERMAQWSEAEIEGRAKTTSPKKITKDADTALLEQELKAKLKMKVTIDHRENGNGVFKINYKDLEQLDLLCKLLSANQ